MDSILLTLIRFLESHQNQNPNIEFSTIAILLSDLKATARDSGQPNEIIDRISEEQERLRNHFIPDLDQDIPEELREQRWTPEGCILTLRTLRL